ncbi:MAG: hypothetical protein LLG20_05030 [Acidobacteriales bacterium]|nr:hypothetical protein [Terriglobales bacterium]
MRGPRFVAALLFVAMMILFLIANRGAYEGYFQDDELDNLAWTPYTSLGTFAREALSPQLSPVNFRPVGHMYFRVLSAAAGLRFTWYVAGIHALHFMNVWLLYLLARRLEADRVTSAAAAIFFAFHMALFDAYWKPMYVFDVLCALFSLLSIHAWIRRRWLISFLCFWLAFKSKEVAVMLPAVLVCYEYWLGERKWKPLVAFLAASLVMGLQGVFLNRGAENAYALHFTPASLWSAIRFYSSQVLLASYAGLALLALPFVVRRKRVWFGMAMAVLTLIPMLLLTNRLYSAYLYVPMAGLALAFPPIVTRRARIIAAAAFLLWIPFNYNRLRAERRTALTIAHENRAYVEQVGKAIAGDRSVRTYICDGAPSAMNRWGVEGAIRHFTGPVELHIYWIEDGGFEKAFSEENIATLVWDRQQRRLRTVRKSAGSPEASYIAMDSAVPVWQLTSGWYSNEETYRWIAPRAAARLYRPDGAQRFELTVNAGSMLLADAGKSVVEILLNGRAAGRAEFARAGTQTVSFPLSPAPAGNVEVEFRAAPAYHPRGDPRVLGIAIAGFGFR